MSSDSQCPRCESSKSEATRLECRDCGTIYCQKCGDSLIFGWAKCPDCGGTPSPIQSDSTISADDESVVKSEQEVITSWSNAITGGIIAGLIFGLLVTFVPFIKDNDNARMIAFAIIFLPLIGALKPFSRKIVGFIMMLASMVMIISLFAT